jgi:hypothetical protein
VVDDRVILPYFISDSSGLCHYWNSRFPFGLLAILLAISERLFFGLSGQHVSGKTGAVFDAWVGGMTAKWAKPPARMLPDFPAADSSGSPKTKAKLPDSAFWSGTRPAKPTCRRPRKTRKRKTRLHPSKNPI